MDHLNMTNDESKSAEQTRPPVWRRRLRRLAGGMLAVICGYGICVLLGLIPVNRGFAPTADGVTIHVFSGPVHSDLILPVANDTIDWRELFPANDFARDTQRLRHLAREADDWGCSHSKSKREA